MTTTTFIIPNRGNTIHRLMLDPQPYTHTMNQPTACGRTLNGVALPEPLEGTHECKQCANTTSPEA